jgi:hypothetical protein
MQNHSKDASFCGSAQSPLGARDLQGWWPCHGNAIPLMQNNQSRLEAVLFFYRMTSRHDEALTYGRREEDGFSPTECG